jgi:hypothetical protein
METTELFKRVFNHSLLLPKISYPERDSQFFLSRNNENHGDDADMIGMGEDGLYHSNREPQLP